MSVLIPFSLSKTLWNDNLGMTYRNRLLLVSLGSEKSLSLNVVILSSTDT